MSTDAIQLVTESLKGLLESTLNAGEVFAGPPYDPLAAAASASLFLYHLVPNAELRNEPELTNLRSGADSSGDPRDAILEGTESASIPFDLRYLISVSRPPGQNANSSPLELLRLGQIIQTLHANPVLSGSRLPGQTVRLTPDPISMEEISRTWGLFPDTAYRTSVVYLATPVFVDAPRLPAVPRVREVRRENGRVEKVEEG
jgi:hypothetical protein